MKYSDEISESNELITVGGTDMASVARAALYDAAAEITTRELGPIPNDAIALISSGWTVREQAVYSELLAAAKEMQR